MKILFGGDDSGVGGGRARSHDPGDGCGGHTQYFCHHVQVHSGDLVSFWLDAVVQLHIELNLETVLMIITS